MTSAVILAARASYDRIGVERDRRLESVVRMSISDGYELRYRVRRFECVGLIHVKPKSVKPRILVSRRGGTNAEVDREQSRHRSSAAGYGAGCEFAPGVNQEIAIRENVHSFCEDDREAFAASGGRGGPVAATSESVGRQSDVRVMPSGKGSPKGGV